MSNKLWIFGDSFSAVPEGDFGFALWHQQVASMLGVNNIENKSLNGVSNDWIFQVYTSAINDMAEGDYVIIQPTQPLRQWFFEDPTLSNYYLKDLAKHVSKEEYNAVQSYIAYLQNDNIDKNRYIQFILALERISSMVQHLKILVIPGFFGISGVQGTLINVCDNEFNSKEHLQKWFDAHGGADPRPNHMSEANHKILADKILNFFKTGQPINLEEGFHKAIINEHR